jgi:hypothetical protein
MCLRIINALVENVKIGYHLACPRRRRYGKIENGSIQTYPMLSLYLTSFQAMRFFYPYFYLSLLSTHCLVSQPVRADTSDDMMDAQLSMMDRRPWSKRTGRRLPKRYRDLLLEPIPLALQQQQQSSQPAPSSSRGTTSTSIRTFTTCVGDRIQTFFTTQRNNFGLFRRYHSEGPPQHDPDENTTANDLSDVTADDASTASEPLPAVYHPFPNRSSFRLGDWYWNSGTQKSQASFKDLVSIVGDPTFSSKDIQDTHWDQVNQTLVDDEAWDDPDAGWTKTEVSILVPFQPRRGAVSGPEAGPKQFVVGDFYHRNLVDVIKEKLSNSNHDDHFHYDPYELKWQANGKSEPVRVHGEMYTSQAFLDVHNALQDSPPEKDCTLP